MGPTETQALRDQLQTRGIGPSNSPAEPGKKERPYKAMALAFGGTVCFVLPAMILTNGDKVPDIAIGASFALVLMGLFVGGTLAVVKAWDWLSAKGLKIGAVAIALLAAPFVSYIGTPTEFETRAERVRLFACAIVVGSADSSRKRVQRLRCARRQTPNLDRWL